MRKETFVSDQIYHLYNRGIEKRIIFPQKQDYFRFIHDIFEFNDQNPPPPTNIRFSLRRPSLVDTQCLGARLLNIKRGPRKLLVEILLFCLMPNHYHLLVRQLAENGITQFMHKLGTGYTNSFNQKYQRVGPLFQGAFKAVLIEKDAHFLHLPYYIHTNPIDLIEPGWKEKEIQDLPKVIQFLKNYRWSSFPDYIGKNNFPSMIQKTSLLKLLGNPQVEEIKKSTINWLKNFSLENTALPEDLEKEFTDD